MAKPTLEELKGYKTKVAEEQRVVVAQLLADNPGRVVRQEFSEDEAEGSITVKTFLE